jgi:carbonic anhydrase
MVKLRVPAALAAGVRLLTMGVLCCAAVVPRNLTPYTELSPAAFWVLCSAVLGLAASSAHGQIAQLPERADDLHHGHHMNIPLGEAECAPQYTYSDGAHGPGNWAGACRAGRMQAPIDVVKPTRMPINNLKFGYQLVDLDVVNDCNQYRIAVKLPDNDWLKIGRKPYFLSEVHFRTPGENAVKGKRPPMSIQFLHLSAEAQIFMIEVPVIAGKENPAFKTLLEHIPAPGKEIKVQGVKFNPMDLLPADRKFYRFPGSLTTPPYCNEGVTWYVMTHPVEFSAEQIAAYKKYYHDTARPLQALNGRPVAESE